jgi:hypothetical protein
VPRLPYCGPLNYETTERSCAIHRFCVCLCASTASYAKRLTLVAFKWWARVRYFRSYCAQLLGVFPASFITSPTLRNVFLLTNLKAVFFQSIGQGSVQHTSKPWDLPNRFRSIKWHAFLILRPVDTIEKLPTLFYFFFGVSCVPGPT